MTVDMLNTISLITVISNISMTLAPTFLYLMTYSHSLIFPNFPLFPDENPTETQYKTRMTKANQLVTSYIYQTENGIGNEVIQKSKPLQNYKAGFRGLAAVNPGWPWYAGFTPRDLD